ncbi:hypothetical protein QF026_005045 [Streptomyces aurantiacus]|uniref:hypothetical protein n=1 Tax=Streptomyces aurantiacus TaxID=47760 RepID=UPI00278F66F9|nr:hypothetical protein [Streptomyces aurantiacus]MDQ0776579.1 hypothetical protein [Streptomyces aurantiacus]
MPEVSDDVRTSTMPIGYRLVPPPGWDMIPLRDGAAEAVKRIVDRGVSQLSEEIPKDEVVKARLELMKRLNKAVQQARKADGLTLYLPVERIHGTLIAASIVVSEALTGPGTGTGSGQVVAHLLADGAGSEPVSVDGADGVRVDKTVAADPEREVEHSSRRIDYVLPVPESSVAQWVTVCFSTIADGNPHSEFAEVLVELFDAVMTTFRWSYS